MAPIFAQCAKTRRETEHRHYWIPKPPVIFAPLNLLHSVKVGKQKLVAATDDFSVTYRFRVAWSVTCTVQSRNSGDSIPSLPHIRVILAFRRQTLVKHAAFSAQVCKS